MTAGVPPGPSERLEGTVTDFDEHAGLGAVASGDGRSWPFHCTAIAGGSRHIDAGTAVSFVVVAGRSGRWEAADVTPG